MAVTSEGKERDERFQKIEPPGSYGLCWKLFAVAQGKANCPKRPDHEGPCGNPVLAFTIPGEPVPYARMNPKGAHGRPFQPDKARAYQVHFATHAKLAAHRARWTRLPAKATVHLTIDIYRSERRADLSNFVKIAEDAINDSQAIWADDRYVVQLTAAMWKSAKPRVQVKVEVLGELDVEKAETR